MANETNLAAPVVPISWQYTLGDPVESCIDCLPWSVEIIDRNGQLFAQEWHAIGCKIVESWTENEEKRDTNGTD